MDKKNNGSVYKVRDLFGNENVFVGSLNTQRKTLFSDYDGFVEKFEPKRTTDDCFTPPAVYDVVVKYVHEYVRALDDVQIVRPFFPGGDYTAVDYPEGCAVIDNPPFSILSEIVRFYLDRGVSFFLFAPHLTLLGADVEATCIITGAKVVYENGANVRTSFMSNMCGDLRVIGEPYLKEQIEDAQKKATPNPTYDYPDEVLTVSKVAWLVERGVRFVVPQDHAAHIRRLESQKAVSKAIFGSGLLLSEEMTRSYVECRREAEENGDKYKAARRGYGPEAIQWPLSWVEKEIIAGLPRKKDGGAK